MGKVYDSDEERYFDAWLDEAMKAGLVLKSLYHPEPFILSSKVNASRAKVNRNGAASKATIFVMHPHSYEYDFKVLLNPAYRGILFCDFDCYDSKIPIVANRRPDGSYIWCVDVKPSFMKDQGSNTRFPINQKWVYSKYKVYVQKIIVEDVRTKSKVSDGFFSMTFTPNAYRFRPMKRQDGFLKCKCKVKSINEYIKMGN